MALIYLTGARGSGKSTVGALLAKDLNCPFADLDSWLCEKEGKSIEQIVAEEGWKKFRMLESHYLAEATEHLRSAANAVLATGGGAVLLPENRKYMRQAGIVIWLKSDPAMLGERLLKNPATAQRPSLTGRGIIDEIEDVCAKREPLYMECATHVVDASLAPRKISALVRAVCHL